MSEDQRLQRMIDAYADGELAEESVGELNELAKSSEDVRRRLALTVVAQRLLTTLGRGPVSSRQIMETIALRAPRLKKPRPRARKQQDSGRAHHPAVAVTILFVLAVAAGGLLWKNHHGKAPFADPASRIDPATDSTVENAGERDSPGRADDNRQLLPERNADPRGTDTGIVVGDDALSTAPGFSSGLPLELPDPPEGEDLVPPATDGSDEPGFVAPAASWPKPPAQTGETLVPAPPVMWVKVRVGEGAPVTPGDVEALMQLVDERLGLRYGSLVRPIDLVAAAPSENPVLYMSGHHHFSFTSKQRRVLRRLILSGGMVVFNAALGSEPFYDSACRELRMILPEVPLQRLGPDHPLYHAYYDLERVSHSPGVRQSGYKDEHPWLEGITISCRTTVVVSRWGLSAGWVDHQEKNFRTVDTENARRLGINLFSYATAVRAWAKRRSHATRFTDRGTPGSSRMFVAQVMHAGEWRTRYEALSVLLHTFNRRTDVPVTLRTRTLRLTDAEVFNAPLLYLTGHEPLVLAEGEVGRLKVYIENGGFLLAEACCGRKGFDRSFRALMKLAFPEHPLQVVPRDATVFRIPNRVELLGVTPSLGARSGSMLMAPRLEGMKVGKNYAVLYSPYGLAGGWEMSQVPYADGYEDPDALKLGQNILMYAITQ
jgi:hypothetical protein